MSKEKPIRVKHIEETKLYWVGFKVYSYNDDGDIFIVAGGEYEESNAEQLRKYLKRKKLI